MSDYNLNGFAAELTKNPVPLTGHLDGKMLTVDWSGERGVRKKTLAKFVVYAVSAPNLLKSKFLGVDALFHGSGYNTALGFYNKPQVTKCPFESIIILFQKWVIRRPIA